MEEEKKPVWYWILLVVGILGCFSSGGNTPAGLTAKITGIICIVGFGIASIYFHYKENKK